MRVLCTYDVRWYDADYLKDTTYDIEDAAVAARMLAFEFQVAASVLHPFVDAAGAEATAAQKEAETVAAKVPTGPLAELGLEQLRELAKQNGLEYKGKSAVMLAAALRNAGVGE